MTGARPTIVSVSGLASNAGKTTVVCELLRRLGGWEAIKISRGHYRSCGKDPQACCVSPLLGDRPSIFSGRLETDAPGKDTGRYWQAGAANVHWLICTTAQVEEGVRLALARVAAPGVIIEGNSFLNALEADFSLMVCGAPPGEIKSSAARIIHRMDALFVMDEPDDNAWLDELRFRLSKRGVELGELPVYDASRLDDLARRIRALHLSRRQAGREEPAAVVSRLD